MKSKAITFGLVVTSLHFPFLVSPIVLKQKWRFDVLDFIFMNSSPDVFNGSFEVRRVRDVGNVLNGYFTLKKDLTDETMLETKIYRYTPGISDNDGFREMSYGIRKMCLSEYMNQVYKPMIMNDLKDCSNFPQLTSFVAPFPSENYTLNNCVFGDNTSTIMGYTMEGVYKVEIIGSGEINGKFIATIKTEILD